MRSRSWHVVVLFSTLLALGMSALAQSATTSVRGTISDTKGLVVTGATVTLNNPATGFSRTAQTDDQGSYQLLEVPPSTYVITVTAAGFATTKRENVVLQVSSPATENMTLQVQGGTVIVDVTAEAPVVNTTDATLGNNFNTRQLTDLPSEGRDPVSILSLQPGVVYLGNQVDQSSDSRGGSVNGARSDQTNVTLDGLDDNDQLNGFAFQGAMRSTLDSLQEFRVTTSNYDAASGRSSGAQVNLVTKSGTNQFHGSLYEYHRPTIGVANDWFNKQAELKNSLPNVPQHILRNTFGGTFGGPIKKDRLFLFAAYEGQRTADQVQVSRIVPSASMRAGELKYLCNVSDPNCTLGDPNGNGITVDPGPSSQLNVATLTSGQIAAIDPGCAGSGTCPWGGGPNPNILAMWGTPTLPLPNGTSGGGDGLNSGSFTFAGNDPVKHDTYIVKLDYTITPNGKQSLFVRGNLQNDHEAQPPQFSGLPSNNFLTNNSKGIAAGYTALLTNTLINNFRYAFIRQGLGNSGLNDQPFNRLRGLSDVVGLTPSILTNVPVHNFIDDVSWTKGKHTIQFGTNWRFIHNNRQSNAQNLSEGFSNLYWMSPSFIANEGTSLDPSTDPTGTYPLVDNSFGTSYSFAAMQLMGIMSQVYTTSNQDKNANLIPNGALVPRHFRNYEGETYIQDKWNVTPNLTVTAGLRYSLLQPPYESSGNQVSPTVNMHQWFTNRWKDMYSGTVNQPNLTFDLSGQANGKKPYWAWDYHNFAPRFAVAYSPHAASGFLHTLFGDAGKSSIRAGYGLYFDHFGEGVVNTFDRQGSWGLTTTISNPAGVLGVDDSPRFTGLHNLPPSPGVPTPHGFPYSPSTDPNTYGLAIAWGIDDNLKTPYSHVVDFSLTRDLGHNFVVEATYTGRFARHLLQEIDLSQPLDLVDPGSKMDYFTAAQTFDKSIYGGVGEDDPSANLAYWNNLFPQAGGTGGVSGCAPNTPSNPTPSQNIYDLYYCFAGNETLSLEILDGFCFPACAGTGTNNLGNFVGPLGTPFSFYQPQFSSLYGWQTRGNSSYNGLQLTLRHAMSSGLQFDFNYTYSKAIDVGSNAERVNGFESAGAAAYNSQVINAFSPNLWRAVSDFDTTHQFNANFIWDMPFGHGRHWGSATSGISNAILGGWTLSGLFRWTGGFPFSVLAGNGWATDFELEGTSFVQGTKPQTGVFRDQDGDPNVFKDAINLTCTCFPGDGFNKSFRATYAGEAGQRNIFRGPGYFGIDGGLAKSWTFKEDKTLRFSWEVFNVTNSVRFDAAGSLPNQDLVDITSFGKLNAELTTPRVMQFALRLAF